MREDSAPIPMISVIVPVYNAGEYFGQSIASFLDQGLDDFEIIIIDDHSTDNTAEVVQSFHSDKIKYVYMECRHGGPSKPRNIGIKTSRGKYIAFCDSDDLALPGRLQDAIDFMESYPEVGMTFTNAVRFEDQSGLEIGTFLQGYTYFESLRKQSAGNDRFIISPVESYNALFYENYILPSGVTVARRVFDVVGLFDESLTNGDDRDMWLRISKVFSIGFIKKIGFRYRVREGSISTRGVDLACNRLNVLRKHLQDEHPKHVVRQIRRLIAENYFSIGYVHQKQGEMSEARSCYYMSLCESPSFCAVKGITMTLLGTPVYRFLRRIKARWRAFIGVDDNQHA